MGSGQLFVLEGGLDFTLLLWKTSLSTVAQLGKLLPIPWKMWSMILRDKTQEAV